MLGSDLVLPRGWDNSRDSWQRPEEQNAGLSANMVLSRPKNQWEKIRGVITSVPRAQLWFMGGIYRQSSKATGLVLEARSANAAVRSDTTKTCDAEAGMRGLQYSPWSSLSAGETLPPFMSPGSGHLSMQSVGHKLSSSAGSLLGDLVKSVSWPYNGESQMDGELTNRPVSYLY